MSLLELPTKEIGRLESFSVAGPAVKISLGSRKVLVDASTGPIGDEHFIRNRCDGKFFGTTGWVAIGTLNTDPSKFMLAYPWKGEAEPSVDRLRSGPATQAIFYMSGVSPEDVCFEALRSFDPSNVDCELDLVGVTHEQGEFRRPHAYLVPGAPTRSTTYTDKFVLYGVGGVDTATFYCALEPVHSGRQIQ